MHFWQGFVAIARKEMLQAFRAKRMRQMLILLQCLDFGMLAWIDLTIRDIPTVIVDQDRSDESRALIEEVAATRTFRFKYATGSTEQARGHIRAGRARAALIIPPDYSRARTSGAAAHVLTLVDGSDAESSAQAEASMEGVAGRMNLTTQKELVATVPAVTPRSILLFNPQATNTMFLLPGLLALILAETYARYTAMSLAKERDAGTLERLLMTPMSYPALILGKLAPWFGIGVINGVVYLAVSRFAFGVPMRGDVLLLTVALSLYLLTIVAVGSYIAAGAKGAGDAQTKVLYYFFPSFWLTGYVFPLSGVPKYLLPIAYALPQTHFIEITRGICLRGATAADLAPHLLYLTVAPVLLTIGAVRRFSRSILR